MWNAESMIPNGPALKVRRGGGAARFIFRGYPMLIERLTAWTLVIVYYTVTCGAIVLGLKGAL